MGRQLVAEQMHLCRRCLQDPSPWMRLLCGCIDPAKLSAQVQTWVRWASRSTNSSLRRHSWAKQSQWQLQAATVATDNTKVEALTELSAACSSPVVGRRA